MIRESPRQTEGRPEADAHIEADAYIEASRLAARRSIRYPWPSVVSEDDIAQAAFSYAWSRRETWDPDAYPVDRWAYLQARTGANLFRRRFFSRAKTPTGIRYRRIDVPASSVAPLAGRGPDVAFLLDRAGDANPESASVAALDAGILLAALDRLVCDAWREFFRLFYFDDLPTREIARRLGASNETVKHGLSQTRKRLRLCFADSL